MNRIDMGPKVRAMVIECSCKDSAGHEQAYACSYYFDGDFNNCLDEKKVYKQTEYEMAGMINLTVAIVEYLECIILSILWSIRGAYYYIKDKEWFRQCCYEYDD